MKERVIILFIWLAIFQCEVIHQQREMLDCWYLLVKVLEASNLERHAG
jgi:hypothetical protein